MERVDARDSCLSSDVGHEAEAYGSIRDGDDGGVPNGAVVTRFEQQTLPAASRGFVL